MVRMIILMVCLVVWEGGAALAVEVGDSVGPVELETLDGHPTVMDNFGERRGTVVLFMSGRCDATEAAMATINRVHVKFRLRGVLFVGVCSNPEEGGDELRTFCQHRGAIFPVYRDLTGKVAAQFGARVTPEAFLLDKVGNVVYHGGIGRLEQAVTSLASNRPIEVKEAPAEGTPIDKPGPKREVDDPHGPFSFSSELVFEKIPWAAAHHCSTICEAGNGDLLCLWYGGSYESADDQVLFLSRLKKGERTWTEPEVAVRNPGQPPGNAVVFRDGLDRIWIVWGRMESRRPIRRGSGWGECRLMHRISTDDGMTWGEDRVFEDRLGWLPRNVPITLKSGELALPLSGRVGQTDGSFLLKTGDNGTTWERSGVIQGGSQPTVVERSDGSLFVMMRKRGRIAQSESSDGGRTWSEAKQSELKNPDAGIAMTRLRNGHLILVFNDSPMARTPLSIARSTDEGKTWETPMKLEANPGEYSYPCVIQSSDGKIHVTYTYRRYAIKHVELDEGWLTHLDRPN